MIVLRAVLTLLASLAGLLDLAEARQPKTLEEIQSTGSVIVCADPDNLPFSSADAARPGYDVEIARALAAELGARAEFKWISTRSARAAIQNLVEGECDLFPGLPASPGFAEEYPRLAFSRPYYTMGHAIVARTGAGVSGLADLARVTTAVEALSTGDLFLLEKRYPRRTYRTQEAAFDAVRAGEVSAALLWAPMAGWFAKRSGETDLRLTPVAGADLSVAFGIGFLRANSTLKPTIDDAIVRLLGRGAVADTLRRYGVPVSEGTGARPRGIVPVAWQSDAADPVEGRLLFEANCEQCHGIDGRGGGAVPRLQSYPRGAEERFVRTVLEGRNSRGMPPWGGLLSDMQVRSIFNYVHALVPEIRVGPDAGPKERARQVFNEVCATCHGATGAGTTIAPSLRAFKGSDQDFVTTVLEGRAGTPMAPYATILTSEAARAIREYVRELGRN